MLNYLYALLESEARRRIWTEGKLRESQEQFRSIVSVAQDAIKQAILHDRKTECAASTAQKFH